MSAPDQQFAHWMWNTTPVDPGPCVLVDMDGVISDASWRQSILASPRPNWDEFFERCGDDPPLVPQVRMLESFDSNLSIALVTARPLRVQPQTLVWLKEHDIRWDVLIMRPAFDNRSSRAYKHEAADHLVERGFEPRLAFEDDVRNVAMFNEIGIPCTYIHSGYYE